MPSLLQRHVPICRRLVEDLTFMTLHEGRPLLAEHWPTAAPPHLFDDAVPVPSPAANPRLALAKAVHDLRGATGGYAVYAHAVAEQATSLGLHELAQTLRTLSDDAIRLTEAMTAVLTGARDSAPASPDLDLTRGPMADLDALEVVIDLRTERAAPVPASSGGGRR